MSLSAKVALLTVASFAVAAGVVHLFWPGGLPALYERATRSAPAPAVPRTPAAPAAQTAAATPQTPEGHLRAGDRAYDRGEFMEAAEQYVHARIDADDAGRGRATRGINKALLAWALTANAPSPDPAPRDPAAELASRQAAAELHPDEQTWYDLALFASGCGLAAKSVYPAQQAITLARAGGPVERRLLQVLPLAGPREPLLRTAMISQGFSVPGLPAAPAPETSAAKAAPRAPRGHFSSAMVTRLGDAMTLQWKGTEEYNLAGPDSADRASHRKRALDHLRKARDIYQAAQEEDPESPDLSRRLAEVMEMLAQLRKDAVTGE
jgi:hypothetical protein